MASVRPADTDESVASRQTSSAGARLFVVIVVSALVLGMVGKLRLDGIFACPAGYEGDAYLAYCQASSYGDFDHGAVWFGLDPLVRDAVREARVLFIGNSRMQFAFSADATTRWFEQANATFYLLGFSHTENVAFLQPLLARIEPRPDVYVLNVDRIFNDELTAPANDILNDPEAQQRYLAKRRWQPVHRRLCSTAPALCGAHATFYRHRSNGTWHLSGFESEFVAAPVTDGAPELEERWPSFKQLADELVASLPVDRQCVLLTLVPSVSTRRAEANAIAQHLGMDLISPRVDNLVTYDGSHLDPASAERWSTAFFEAAGDRIASCIRQSP